MFPSIARTSLYSLVLILPLAACNSSGSGDGDTGAPGGDAGFTVGGEVTGLTGDQLILRLNDAESLTIESNGPFEFSTQLEDGESYSVSTQVLPEAPAQNCDLENIEGTVSAADVSDIAVSCHGAIQMIGRVAGPIITDADIEAQVGETIYQTSSDEQGMYALRLSIREPDDMVSLKATDPTDGFILFRSYLGDMERVQSLATNDGLLTREQNVGVNITNVSTANAALMRWQNEGQAPETEAERVALRDAFSANLLLRSSALIRIAVEDPDRTIVPAAGGSLRQAGLAMADSDDTSSLIEQEETRISYEQEVLENDPDSINNAIAEIVSDPDLVQGIDEDDTPNDWFGITGPEPNIITGTQFRFEEDGTGLYSNHVDAVTFQWEVIDGTLELNLDDELTTGAFCWVEDEDGNDYQTVCITRLDEFGATLVAQEDGMDIVSISQTGTRDFPDEPDRESVEVDFRTDMYGHHLSQLIPFEEADIVDQTWAIPGNFPALLGGLAWYGDELLTFTNGGVGEAVDSGLFNWSLTDEGWLRIEFGSGAVHEIGLKSEQRLPVWRSMVLSATDDGQARSSRSMIAPQLDDSGLDEAFASDLFVQWGYQTGSDYAFAIDLTEDGWGGVRNVYKPTDEILGIHYEFDYRFEAGTLHIEAWAQPRDDGPVWWGRESICDDSQQADCYLTMVRSWTLLHDDGDWVSLLERIENLDEDGEPISISPRVIQYRRF
ncbi:hypothetical protein [Natronospira bacteriovora]|uniref:Carboxypeptidase family protein n=1 Tax=Natronospira bacteriovora TaxID=3069753 RepID=A0ABU0W6J5_9GAMM|nr:hypothetical protein [Natronospira sp. AB-CW4]MDQ2068625.1 hypothetical protein [Natronospira sp. AB-CW4]